MQKMDYFEFFVVEAKASLEHKQTELEERYGIGRGSEYRVNLDVCGLSFLDAAGKEYARTVITPVGIHVVAKNAWQWFWANKSAPGEVWSKSARIKELAGLLDVGLFQDDSFELKDDSMSWEIGAMAVHYLGSKGLYAPPAPSGSIYFFAIDSVQLLGADGKPVPAPGGKKIAWDTLTVRPKVLPGATLLQEWEWLVPGSAKLLLVTALGDLFLQDTTGSILRLDAGWGKCYPVARSIEEFKALTKAHAEDWFRASLVAELNAQGSLETNQCWGCKLPPAIGGAMEPENFEPTDLIVHHATLGQIHGAIKDMPVGTTIKGFNVEE